MNEQEVRELLKLIRNVEHYLERCLKVHDTRQQLEKQGVVVNDEPYDQHYMGKQCTCGTTDYTWHRASCALIYESGVFEF